MKILISPWARQTTEGKPSPKNYPWWDAVVGGLSGLKVVQVSCKGEPGVPGCERFDDLPLKKIAGLVMEYCTWLAPDNFLPHFAWSLGKRGVAIFGPSDPVIFGHPENINLLKSRKYLRVRQWGLWSQDTPNPDAFVAPGEVVSAVKSLLNR